MTEGLTHGAMDGPGAAYTSGAKVARPEPGQTATVTAEPGRTYILDFDPSEAQVSVQGDDLILVFEDGARLVFEDLVSLTQLENGPNLQYAGSDVIALLIAWGSSAASHGSFSPSVSSHGETGESRDRAWMACWSCRLPQIG